MRDGKSRLRALDGRLLLQQLRAILLGVLHGAIACAGQMLIARILLLCEYERRLGLIDLSLARIDLRLLHGDLSIDIFYAGRRGGNLRLGLLEGDPVVAIVNARNHAACGNVLVIGDGDLRHVTRYPWGDGDLARGDESIVGRLEMAGIVPVKIAATQQRANAEANLEQAIAQRDQAKLNLSYTTVTAAERGRAVNLTAEPGEFAQAGTSLTMFVPDDIWVTANFKETQLDQMRPGQAVTLSIDAYPEREIKGHVASVQPGSGTAFSLLPAQNATGNYVKIVQRVPVKILIDNAPADVALGPGMSVVPSVRVNPKPSLLERMTSTL